MQKLRKKQLGFTLIELLIVVIIVAVLAAVGVPLLRGNVERAKMTEADAGLGTIRTALRAEFAEKGSFPSLTNIKPVAAVIGIKDGDLTGRYFEDDDYAITTDTAASPQTYCIKVTGDTAAGAAVTGIQTSAPKGDEVNGKSRSMNVDGTIFDSAICS